MTAVISECGRYRYVLSRTTDCPLRWVKRICWIMLNPSTADATVDDPTIRRCKGFSALWGFTYMTVVNLYALRATDPRELWTADDPVGPENNQHILAAARGAHQVVCAWGKPGPELTRALNVRRLLENLVDDGLYWLKLNKDGSPSHPLYLPYSLKPQLWQRAAQSEPAPL